MVLGPIIIPWLKPRVIIIFPPKCDFSLLGSFSQEVAPFSHYTIQNLEVIFYSYFSLTSCHSTKSSSFHLLTCDIFFFTFLLPWSMQHYFLSIFVQQPPKTSWSASRLFFPIHCSLKATVTFLKEKFNHPNHLLKTLHWSSIAFGIKFKIFRLYQAFINLLLSLSSLFFTPPCLPLTKVRELPSVPEHVLTFLSSRPVCGAH